LALAADVEHWLADEPVSAYRDPLTVRLTRWGRRHQQLVTGGTALLLTAVAALAVGLLVVERERARTAAARAQAEANFQLAKDAVDRYLNAITEDPRLKMQDFFELRKKLLETALPFYEKFAQARAGDPEQEVARGRAYFRLAFVREQMGETGAALADYEQARAIFAHLAVECPTVPAYRQELATTHNNLGILLATWGGQAEAEVAYRQALTLQDKLAADFPSISQYRHELARSQNNLGNLLKNLGKWPEAEVAYRQALTLQEKLGAEFPTVPAYRQALALSHNNLGLLLEALGKRSEAKAAYRQALNLFAQLTADFPSVPQYRHELARSHNNLGVLLTHLGEQVEAVAQFRQALALGQKQVADFPTVPEYRQELARSQNNLGLLLRLTGRLPEAEAQSRQALALQARLAADFPAVPEYRQELARSYGNLGNRLMHLGKWPDAEAAHRQALALQNKLATDFPAVPAYAVELAGSYCNLGSLVRERGEAAASLDWYGKGLATLQPVLAKEPQLVTARLFLRNVYSGRAQALAQLGRDAEAAADWEQARALNDEKLRDEAFRLGRAYALVRAGQPAAATVAVEDLLKPANTGSGTLYAAARVYALAAAQVTKQAAPHTSSLHAEQYARRAVALLRQAVQKGYKNIGHLKKDTDLDSLRRRADFQQLLADLEAKPPSK
jgi:serine/threonine-protein kinase